MILLTKIQTRVSSWLDSFVGSILTALAVSDTSFAGDQVALKQGIVARMLENFEVGSDCCAQFPLLWSILQEEIRTSNPEVGASKAALLVLGGSCELRLTLSDAQFNYCWSSSPMRCLLWTTTWMNRFLTRASWYHCCLAQFPHQVPSFRSVMLISSKTDQALGLSATQKMSFLCFSCLFVLTWWCLM